MDPSQTDVAPSAPSVVPPVVPPRTYVDRVNNDAVPSQTNTQPEVPGVPSTTPYPPTPATPYPATDTTTPYPPPSASLPPYPTTENSSIVDAPSTQPQNTNPPGDPPSVPESVTLPYPIGQSTPGYTAPYPPSNDSPYPAPEVPPAAPNSTPYPMSPTPYPPNDGTNTAPGVPAETNNGTPGTNDTSLIIDTNAPGTDGAPRSVEGHVLAKLPSYHGGGDFPAEPPPSYAETYPVQIPENVVPRHQAAAPRQANVPPTSQVISRTYGDTPTYTRCPHCNENVTTMTAFVPGGLTYIMMFIILLLGGWFGCCLIPFCVDGLKDVYHHCPNCKRVIGQYERMG